MARNFEWRVYYDDGSTFDNLEGGPADAPKLGVIAINQIDKHVGFATVWGKDFYPYSDDLGGWEGTDQFGFYDYLFCRPGYKVVLAGRTVPHDDFIRLRHKALHDPDFPPKSGWHEGEVAF